MARTDSNNILPCFRETENVTMSDVSLEGKTCSNFILLSRDWTLASRILESGAMCTSTEPKTKRPLCRAVVFGRILGLDPMSWMETDDLLRESRIPGRMMVHRFYIQYFFLCKKTSYGTVLSSLDE